LGIQPGERGQQVWVGTDEAVPDVEYVLDSGSQQVTGPAQRNQVFVAEQQRRLQ
jgi:hypothetical protein